MPTPYNLLVRTLKPLLSPAPPRKTISLHIPKTAGTSLRKIVSAEYPGERLVTIYDLSPDFLAGLKPRLKRAHAIYGHYSFGIHELLGIEGRCVALLRDPVERVISLFHHKATRDDNEYREAIQQGLTLLELLRSESCHEFNNHQVRIISGHVGLEMVHNRYWLEQALTNIEKEFAFVGTTEQFSETVEQLATGLGWKNVPEVLRLNAGDRSAIYEIDEETRNEIRRYNQLDIELYEIINAKAGLDHGIRPIP